MPTQPNQFLKGVKKPWPKNIPINFTQTKNISNQKNCPVNDTIVWKGQKLTYQWLKTQTEDERDEIAKDLFNYFVDYNWDVIDFSNTSYKNDWKKLQKTKCEKFIENDLTVINNSSTCGCKIYKHFFPNILKISSKNKESVYEALHDKELLWKIIRNRIGNTLLYNTGNNTPRQWPMTITPAMIIQGAKCSGHASIGSIFKPAVAKTIYQSYVNGDYNVYDYSAGFGGRLLGLMSLNIPGVKYFACEPNTETYDNLVNMSTYLGFNTNIVNKPSEDVVFEEKMDFIFSSPPYFNYEKYSTESTQCYNKYPDYNVWLEEYWRKTVINCRDMLKKGGVFSVNIGNSSNATMLKISDDIRRIVLGEGFTLKDVWYMKTSKSHLSNKKNNIDISKLEGIYFYGVK